MNIDGAALVFDAVGTLIHPHPPVAAVYAAVGQRHGSRITADAVSARFRFAFARHEAADRQAGWRTDEDREHRRWREIVAEVLDTDSEACFADLWAHFGRPDAWRIDPDAADLLPALTRHGHRLAVASNFDGRLRSVLAGFPALAGIEVVISSEIGWRKPAGAFFAALAGRLGVSAADVVVVGDDIENDYRGATAAGMRAVLLDPDGRAEPGIRTVVSLRDMWV